MLEMARGTFICIILSNLKTHFAILFEQQMEYNQNTRALPSISIMQNQTTHISLLCARKDTYTRHSRTTNGK